MQMLNIQLTTEKNLKRQRKGEAYKCMEYGRWKMKHNDNAIEKKNQNKLDEIYVYIHLDIDLR